MSAPVKAIIRRKKFDGQLKITFNEIELNPSEKEVKINDKLIKLTTKQYDILEFFIANKNRVVTKESIAGHLWNGDAMDAHNLDFIYNHVKNVRIIIKNAGGKGKAQEQTNT